MRRHAGLSLLFFLAIFLIAEIAPLCIRGDRTNPFFGPAYAWADMYGAIAYSSSGDRWGTSYNFRSRSEAESRALSECGSSDCVVKVWFKNGCGALATGDDGSLGWGWSGSRSGAESRALSECQKRTSGCRVRCWACTDR